MAKMRSRLAAASSSVTAPPVRAGYLSKGPLTSTAKVCTRRAANSSATISGRMPLESILMGSPNREISLTSSAMSSTVVGSPPVMVMPSSQTLRRSK